MKADTEGLERTEGTDAAPFLPAEEWIDAFERQASAQGFEERLKRFARMRARMVGHAGRCVDDLYARELVQDAIDDTLEGVLSWKPDRCSLEQHLFGAIRSRTRHDFVRAKRFPHDSFDATSAPTALMADVERSLASDNPTASVEAASAAHRAVAEIRRIAAADADVLRLIDAYAADATKKVDVLRVSGLTSKRYEAARKRLQRIVLQLPEDVRQAVRA